MPSFLKATGRTYFIASMLGLTMFVLCFIVGRQASCEPHNYKDRRYYYSKRVLDTLESLIEKWRKDHDVLPDSLNLLIDYDGDITDDEDVGWYYLKVDEDNRVCDCWYHPIVYKIEGDNYELISYGEDGKPGGTWFDSDISNRQPYPPKNFPPSWKSFLFGELGLFAMVTGLFTGGFCFLGCLWVLREEVPPADVPDERKSGATIRNVFSVFSKSVGIVGVILFSIIVAFVLGVVYLPVTSGH